MVGSIGTSYSYKNNDNQIYVVSKLSKKDYYDLLSTCAVAVSMIYAPHPGVIAFQTAASGIPTITNVFDNRDSVLLKEISKNFIPYNPIFDNLLELIELALKLPRGEPSFNEYLYSGNQEGSLEEYYERVISKFKPTNKLV
jgi:hypothetical protein